MTLDLLIKYLYQSSIPDLIRWSILAVLVAAILHRNCGMQYWWKPMTAAALCVWTAAVLSATVLSRELGDTHSFYPFPLHSYLEVLHGGNPELLRSNFMNILLFFPAGVLSRFLLTESSPPRRRLAVIVAVFFCFSLSIETMQYLLAAGHFEADDILHNTLGAVTGYALCGWALGNVSPTN